MAECEVAVGLLGEEQEGLPGGEAFIIGLLYMRAPLPPSLVHVHTRWLPPGSPRAT